MCVSRKEFKNAWKGQHTITVESRSTINHHIYITIALFVARKEFKVSSHHSDNLKKGIQWTLNTGLDEIAH